VTADPPPGSSRGTEEPLPPSLFDDRGDDPADDGTGYDPAYDPAYDTGYDPDHPGYGDDVSAQDVGPGERPPGEVRLTPRGRRVGTVVALVVVLLVVGGIAVLVAVGLDRVRGVLGQDPPADYSGPGSGSVVFEVQKGDVAGAIGRNLKADGVVASVEAFTNAAKDDPKSRGIQPGFYDLKKRMPAADALDVLVDPANMVQSKVTIPEGLRVEDTVARLAKATGLPVRGFRKVLADPSAIGLPAYAKGNAEGYLFPATYAFGPDATPVDVLKTMVDRWRVAAKDADLEASAARLGYTPGQLMTVASLVEAEANRDQDRGKVARVIYNRLETDATNHLLQIDATVNYALGRDLGLALTTQQLQVDSPYNTRRYPGLPPGPIESPGDKAIAAAANPTKGPWVYYATVNLDTGETKFTASYDQFLHFRRELQAFCDTSDRC
jgi:UPF0755 protein